MAKSTFVTYLLWLMGGAVGLHHFYLGRDTQAFVWSTSWGVFGIGWMRDMFRIPAYVAEANDDKHAKNIHMARLKDDGRPSVALSRIIAALFIGAYFNSIFGGTGQMFGPLVGIPLAIIGSAVGVWLIGNIGLETSPFQKTLAGATIGFFVLNSTVGALVAHFYYVQYRPWPHTHDTAATGSGNGNASTVSRFFKVYGLSFLVFIALLVSSPFEITNERGETIKLQFGSFSNAWNSPNWNKFYKFDYNNGWNDWAGILDLEGEHRALRILGLEPGAEKEVIVKAYRKCALKYHPDKNKDNPEATEMFMQCSEAHETLIKIHKRREGIPDPSHDSMPSDRHARRKQSRGARQRGGHGDL